MKTKLRHITDIIIIIICIFFTYAVVTASARNNCLEIKEQYFAYKTRMIATDLEMGINAGLNINNYYGIDDVAKSAAIYDSEHIDAVILNSANLPVAQSFDITADDGAERLASVFLEQAHSNTDAVFYDAGGKRFLSQPFDTDSGKGHIVLIYDKSYFAHIDTLHLIKGYKDTMNDIVDLALEDITEEVRSLNEKGLRLDDILNMEYVFNSRFTDFGLIDSVELSYKPYGTHSQEAFSDDNSSLYVSMSISSEYVNKTYMWIFLTLLAALIICFMVIIEFLPIRKIARAGSGGSRSAEKSIPIFIRFISFFVYLAVYTVLPYGAIIINSNGESILGLPVAVSASLPITLEAIALLAMLSVSPLVFKKTGIKKYTLLTGLCTVVPSVVCFLYGNVYTIIICSIFLGITQGLLKYLMNYLISICSRDAGDISINYGEFNIGTLTGITVGGSLGSIIAANTGYSFVYIAAAAIMLVIITAVLIFLPYDYINKTHKRYIENETKYSYSEFLKQLAVSPGLVLNMFFTVGVVAISLMFIIAFMPVALDLKGLSPMISTYGFLIYGIAGNYISGYMLKKARALTRKTAAFAAMLIMALSVLVIIPDINAVTIMTASFLTGIFDGYGAPSVTSAFMNIRKARGMDSSLMLTGTALVGGVGNAAAPVIYSTILYSGNMSVNLCLLFVFFLFSGVFILHMKE